MSIPWEYRLVDWLARHLPRWLALALMVRRVAPRDTEPWPWRTVTVPDLDTGGAFRAAWRPQDPSRDPREPNGSESSQAGNDHGWSNCTMAAAAMALAYQRAPSQGSLAPWGGDMRHRQSDLSGGTDLYDARTAWAAYGETLTIRSGAGWSAVDQAHREGRAIIVQGQGNVPGNQTFDGGHACVIAPETLSDGKWLFGDPLATGWQWVTPSSIKTWMAAWSSGYAFAVGEKPPAPTPVPPDPVPPKPPTPPPPPPGPSYAEGLAAGTAQGEAAALDRVFASWRPGLPALALVYWGAATWGTAAWYQTPLPLGALAAARTPAAWDVGGWAAATWQGDPPPPPGGTPWDAAAWSSPWAG